MVVNVFTHTQYPQTTGALWEKEAKRKRERERLREQKREIEYICRKIEASEIIIIL